MGEKDPFKVQNLLKDFVNLDPKVDFFSKSTLQLTFTYCNLISGKTQRRIIILIQKSTKIFFLMQLHLCESRVFSLDFSPLYIQIKTRYCNRLNAKQIREASSLLLSQKQRKFAKMKTMPLYSLAFMSWKIQPFSQNHGFYVEM